MPRASRRPDIPHVSGPVPARIRHSKGGGAHGRFEVFGDVRGFTSARVFQPGAQTNALVRFSATLGHLGSPEVWRDLRGFAVKFFTADGEYDLVGNNSPIFYLRDEAAFASLVVSQKLFHDDPLYDVERLWRFWTTHPESAHQVTWLFGDRGIPRSWRHQDGFGSHTFQWTNAAGGRFWIKYHLRSDQGNAFLTDAEAAAVDETEVEHRRADLRHAIDRGDFPSWTLAVQVMPYDHALRPGTHPFDLTRVWPKAEYPLVTVGRLTLDRNPDDELGEIEQAAFAPSNLVPGIGASPDPMLLSRIESYWRFHRHRVNPEVARWPAVEPPALAEDWDADIAARAREIAGDDFAQPGALVRTVLDDAQRARLAANVRTAIAPIRDEALLADVLAYWHRVDPDVANALCGAAATSAAGGR